MIKSKPIIDKPIVYLQPRPIPEWEKEQEKTSLTRIPKTWWHERNKENWQRKHKQVRINNT